MTQLLRVYLPYIVQAPDTVSAEDLAHQLHAEFALGVRPLRPYRGIRIARDRKASRCLMHRQLTAAERIG
jgi:hypothetical protein